MEDKKENKINSIEDKANSKEMNSLEKYLQQTNAMREVIGLSASAGFTDSIRESIKGIATMAQQTNAMREAIRLSVPVGLNDMLKESVKAIAITAQQIDAMKEAIGLSASAGFNDMLRESIKGIAIMAQQTNEMREAIRLSVPVGFNDMLKESIKAIAMTAQLGITLKDLKELEKRLKEVEVNSIKINTDSSISYNNEKIILDDTVNEINSFIDENISWEEKISKILASIKSKNPIIIFLIVTFLIAPFYEYYLDCTKGLINTKIETVKADAKAENDKSKIIKDIKKEVAKGVELNCNQDKNIKSALNEYRFVTIDCLNVRVNTSTKSKIIYNLKFGQTIRVLNKDKNWTLIEYTDDENVYVKGWVYTRYISRFD